MTREGLNELFKWNQLHRDRVVPVGIACPPQLAEACECYKPYPSEWVVGEKTEGISQSKRLEENEKLPQDERLHYWMDQFNKCIKCYGCRDVCPMCFCKVCSLQDRNFILTGKLPTENPTFHLSRAVHMVGRCIDCGLCEEACPSNIPVRTLYKKVGEIVSDLFDYKTGDDPEGKSPSEHAGGGYPGLIGCQQIEGKKVRKMEYKSVLTTCGYCGCGCGLYLEVMDGELVGTMPCKTDPVSQGGLCIKGWNVHEFVNSGERLSKPLLKKGGQFSEVTWDKALQVTADTFKKIRDKSGPDSIAFLSSAKCTNEENYLLQKLARAVVGTNNVDHCARLCHSSTVAGLAAAFGSGAMTNTIDEIEGSRCIFVIGSNTTEAHPLIGSRIIKAKEKGAQLIVADPRKIHLAGYADIYVRQNLGTDVALINGIMNVILKEGWHNSAFIKERTEGFEAFQKVVEGYTPEKVEEITGVHAEDIKRIAEAYARSESSTIVYAMGITQHINRRGQCQIPGQSGHALRADRPREHGRESASRPEQRSGGVRHGCPPQRLSGLSGR